MSVKFESGVRYENVAVSTRIRLARNFSDRPFPNRLKDRESAREIVRLVAAELNRVDVFDLYYMDEISDERAAFFKERYLISQALIRNRAFSAVLVLREEDPPITFEEELAVMRRESVSVMVNEEDHVREQYIVKGLDLERGFERITGIDDTLSETLPFAFDEKLGYLTACPTNVGTGLRASVMLFLPALSRRGKMRDVLTKLRYLGLTVRGLYGEGSGADGDLYQISNEVTLGAAEEEILSVVNENAIRLVEDELLERERMKQDGGMALTDRLLRSYGILTNCIRMEAKEFTERMADIKLGVALGVLDGDMEELDNLVVAMRHANITRLNGVPLEGEEENFFRAAYAGRKLRGMDMLSEKKRNGFTAGG